MSETPDPLPAPDWYPDPGGGHELRYWNGSAWTDDVADQGRPGVAPLSSSGDPGSTGSGIFDQPILVVNQKAKLIELNTEYAIHDQNGTQIGAIRQVGQSALKKVARFVTSLDQFMSHSLQVIDMAGQVQLTVTRPRKVFKSRVIVADARGSTVGEIVQRNMIGKIRFSLEAAGIEVGSLNGENWRAWNFNIKDATGVEVARITKTWEGLAKTMFTTADNYVLQIHSPLDDPLRSLVVASAAAVDLALKQDARGLG